MNSLPVSICPRCRHRANISEKHRVCSPCWKVLRDTFAGAQEREYLARYLSTRADVNGEPVSDSALTVHAHEQREVRRLVSYARALGVDWTRPPVPMHFDARMAVAQTPYSAIQTAGNKRGRPRKHQPVSLDLEPSESFSVAS